MTTRFDVSSKKITCLVGFDENRTFIFIVSIKTKEFFAIDVSAAELVDILCEDNNFQRPTYKG